MNEEIKPDRAKWHLAVTARAERDLSALPPRVASAIVEFITTALLDNPSRLSGPLTNELAAYRSVHHGDYRVLIELNEDRQLVTVHRIGHRAHIYRPS